jgi:hypothetical protein
MSIRAARPRFVAVFLCLAALGAAAQESGSKEPPPEGDLPIESEWGGAALTKYVRGDQTFAITVGAGFPLSFITKSGHVLDNNVNTGGIGSLSYNYFLSPHFALGGELGGFFGGTLGGNMMYIIPFGLRATWQFLLGSFEFPVSLLVGGASQNYLGKDYFGFFAKPAVGTYWRFNQDWSFGVNTAWWWVPQMTSDSSTSVFGNFAELTLSARYHF